MYPISLTGRAVTLREFRANDTPAAYQVVGDDRVTLWLSFDSRSPEATQDMIDGAVARARNEPRDEYYLAVINGDDQLIGFARLGLSGVKAAKLGYAIHADHWGRGYATDAARTMIAFGFDHLGLRRISAAIGPDNDSSIRVAERLGFTFEGTLRDHVFTNGAWRDSRLYSILATDPRV
ncbi:N-acetyltransferase [Longispora fulva]|uniref:RimJ/RimL family protein N-acetyltransferase n=1 Tax=Longispora fulva TaxID=619741 RepID=A0A8J7KID0_9ACTN|nr:GNAT family protein [Longispora fulva]MBG6136039.1 RimJ/RimL family protein N-acetyltransferase [Longispora fulva]GIG55719.1 N-acetyltransferase [Longispora fulva]